MGVESKRGTSDQPWEGFSWCCRLRTRRASGISDLLQLLIQTLISPPQTLAQLAECCLWLLRQTDQYVRSCLFHLLKWKHFVSEVSPGLGASPLWLFVAALHCVQCCTQGLYNLAALGNYKDKWREAQSITHPVREGGLRRGIFVFSKASTTTTAYQGFLVPHPLFIQIACPPFLIPEFFSIHFDDSCFNPLSISISVSIVF